MTQYIDQVTFLYWNEVKYQLMLIAPQWIMESNMEHLIIAVLFASSTMSGACNGLRKIRKSARWAVDSQISTWNPAIDQENDRRNAQLSNERNHNIVINVNNFYCTTGSQEINMNPLRNKIVNIALEPSSTIPSEYKTRGRPVEFIEEVFELLQRLMFYQCGDSLKYDQCDSSANHGGMRSDFDDEKSSMNQNLHGLMSKLGSVASMKPTNDMNMLKDIICNWRGDMNDPKVEPLNHRRLRPLKTIETSQDWEPKLQLFIEGNRINKTQEEPNFKTGIPHGSSLMAEDAHHIKSVFAGNDGKATSCEPAEYAPCSSNNSVVFHGGFELTFEELERIFEEITKKPDEIQVIVPGGVRGPMLGYFQKVDVASQELAVENGVCLLSNGFLVPMKPMLTIVKLHGWLSLLNSNLNSKTYQLINLSMWKDIRSIFGVLQCLIESGRVMVQLPSNLRILFSQFEKQDQYLPNTLLEQMNVQVLGFSIHYNIFKNGLLELCSSVDRRTHV